MKFLKTSMALLVVFGITLAFNQLGVANVVKDFLALDSEKSVDTTTVKEAKTKTVFELADSICMSIGVPFELVVEIGNNESGWRYIQNTAGGTDMGDLQVIDETFDYWYEKLALTGGKTRLNYLIIGIHYLKYQHERYGSWEKARFAYGRGNWRPRETWTCLEEKFMAKIDWTKYDSGSYVKK